jgi:diguanylate cyclase (GGDEF)-like protein
VNTADLIVLLLGAATAVLCGVAAREAWERARLPGQPRQRRWRSWVWVVLDLSIPAQVLAVLATLRQRDRLEAELAAAAQRDPLTRLPNRTGFAEAATLALVATARDGRPVVAMLDIDFFKAINDGWGHGAGDVVLRDVAAAMRAVLRPGDVLARVGGEEFVLLLPGVDMQGAGPLLERLRVAAASVPHPGAPGQRVTLSAGLVVVEGTGLTPPRPPGATG